MPITGKTWGLPGLKVFSGKITPKKTVSTATPSSRAAPPNESPLGANPGAQKSDRSLAPRNRKPSLDANAGAAPSTSPRADVGGSAEASKAQGVASVKRTSLERAAHTKAALEKAGLVHMQLAERADARVRKELYNPEISLMSDNKADWRNDMDTERTRANAASEVIKAIRTSGVNRLKQPEAYSKQIWEHTDNKAKNAHNCDELCHATEDCIAEENPSVPLNRLQFKYVHPDYGQYGHSVTVIGALTPEILATPMKDWPPDLVICDVWGDIPSCRAQDYAEKFLATMDGWKENEIDVRIRPNRWEDANEPDWTEVVNHVEGALVRSMADEGPLQYKVMLPKPPVSEASQQTPPAAV
jgi:hypothetical protein